jgi:hypothetical protein
VLHLVRPGDAPAVVMAEDALRAVQDAAAPAEAWTVLEPSPTGDEERAADAEEEVCESGTQVL